MKKLIVTVMAVMNFAMLAMALPATSAVVKSGEKVATKLGLRIAGANAVRGGAKLAAVTAEREAAKRMAGGTAEGVVKSVTAKQILAAGGGSAMVVAAHECADGVQQMGEGVKEAVSVNPDVAVGVAETVTAPIKWLAAMAGAFLLAFLAWFIWPWISLVRNWSRLAAAKRMAAMRSVAPIADGAEDVIDVVSSYPSPSHSGFTHCEMIIVIAGFLILTILGVRRIVRSDSKEGDMSSVEHGASVCQEAQIASRAQKIARLKSDYATAIGRHFAEFLSDVDSVAASRFGDVRAKVPDVVEKFGAFSRCKDLLVTLFKDKMDQGSRTEMSITRDLEADFYRGLYDAHDKVNAQLVAFLKKVEAERQSFKRDLEVELDSIELPNDEAFRALLADGGDRIEKCKRELGDGQFSAAISAVVEASCIRVTISTIARLLGKSAARMAGSVAVGAGASVADGPLPFGEAVMGVLVLGSTCWSAYDIIHATRVLPKEMGETLYSVVDECKAKTIVNVRNAGYEIYNAYRHDGK